MTDSTSVVAVALLDGEAADDAGLIDALRDVVNEAYARGEVGLWREGAERISDEAVHALVASGELAAAREDGRVVGCVRVTSLDPRTAELGLLAVAGERSGSGVGRALIAFAHDLARGRGHTAMRLTLLVPQDGSHPFKVRLDDWYRRQGYRVVGRADFAATHPKPARLLVAPCDLVTFERALG
jgi:GNAT superfamily N-acetyltransferase